MTETRKSTIWRKCVEPLPSYAPADEGIIVQLLLSGTAIIGMRHHITLSFDMNSHFA